MEQRDQRKKQIDPRQVQTKILNVTSSDNEA